MLCPSSIQKKHFIYTRSFCRWCHCKSHWVSMAHDNYRNRGYPLRSSVLFPSKSTCQRGENGKHNVVSLVCCLLLFCIFAFSFRKMGPAQFISPSCITFGMNPPFFISPRHINKSFLLVTCYKVADLIIMTQGPAGRSAAAHAAVESA